MLVSVVSISNGQKITEYKASNGVTYHLKDTVKMGQGSGLDGWFVYMLPSMVNTSDAQREWFKRKFTNTAVILKKIDIKEVNGIKKYRFTVGGGAMYNIYLSIEEAITNCEVIPCSKSSPNKLTQLKLLKDLLDNEAITPSEFETEKKKLLN